MPTLRVNKEEQNSVYFITFTVIEWIDIFTKIEYFDVIIKSLDYCRKNKGLLLYEYVIMTNHLHLIAQAKEGSEISQIISDFKKHTTRQILKLLGKDNRGYILNLLKRSFSKKKGYVMQIWQRENYPELLVTEKFLRQKAMYLYLNPVRKGYVSKPEGWLYSSARNRLFDDSSIIEIDSLAY